MSTNYCSLFPRLGFSYWWDTYWEDHTHNPMFDTARNQNRDSLLELDPHNHPECIQAIAKGQPCRFHEMRSRSSFWNATRQWCRKSSWNRIYTWRHWLWNRCAFLESKNNERDSPKFVSSCCHNCNTETGPTSRLANKHSKPLETDRPSWTKHSFILRLYFFSN